jgi:hypothetical protein
MNQIYYKVRKKIIMQLSHINCVQATVVFYCSISQNICHNIKRSIIVYKIPVDVSAHRVEK